MKKKKIFSLKLFHLEEDIRRSTNDESDEEINMTKSLYPKNPSNIDTPHTPEKLTGLTLQKQTTDTIKRIEMLALRVSKIAEKRARKEAKKTGQGYQARTCSYKLYFSPNDYYLLLIEVCLSLSPD